MYNTGMKTILFATTNPSKLLRFKNFLRDLDLNILSLQDLGYKIEEPKEKGNTPVEIAINKAKYYYDNLKIKYPVVTQDDTMEYLNIPELKDVQLSIKGPVVKEYGEFSVDNAIKYYTNLAKKYGGKIKIRYNYGFGICSDNILKGEDAELNCYLVSEQSKLILPGYPLSAISKVIVNNKEVFYSDMTLEEQVMSDEDLARAVKYLLSEMKE